MICTRKEFLKTLGLGIASLFCPIDVHALLKGGSGCSKSIKGHVFEGDAPKQLWKYSKEAYYYAKADDQVQCLTCPHECVLGPGDRGICRSKVNIKGRLYSITYGNPCAIHVDPIEKKPLFHFHPRTWIFSIATTGCNLRCLNCQNWEISQKRPEDVQFRELFPEDVVDQARAFGVRAIAYTYSEPISFYEYMFDIAKLARRGGIRNVMVSNGYVNREPLLALCKFLDGASINLKSFSDRIYQCLNGGRLQPVLNTFKTLKEQGVWFEMINLVIPTYTDDPDMLKRMCGWILKELGPDYPLHFLRFFPRYRLQRLTATPVSTLERFRQIAMSEGIKYVYIGNVPGHPATNTYCHNCKRLLIKREGYYIPEVNIVNGKCKFCGASIPGRWDQD